MTLSFKDIAEILKAIDESSADEINLEVEGLRLAVSKRTAVPTGPKKMPTSAVDSAPVAEHTTPELVAHSTDENQYTASDIQVPSGHEILRAPMVGTFYRKPNPDEPTFVEVGTTVVQGDPMCLIEVMKLYTTIEATTAGEIVSIFAEDGNLVEFDQPLFLIKTA